MKEKDLVYFEDSITPSFGMTDLCMMAPNFKRVFFFSENVVPEYIKEKLPTNVIVIENYLDWSKFSPRKILLSRFPMIVSAIFFDMINGKLKVKDTVVGIKRVVNNAFKAQTILQRSKDEGIDLKAVVWFAFWFYDCIYLALLKKLVKGSVAVARAHAGDLFEDGSSLQGQVLLRAFQLKNLSAVLPISLIGQKYLTGKYPKCKNKIRMFHLGTNHHDKRNPFDPSGFTILTCSHVRNIKRVHLVAQALQVSNFPINWYHIGDEGQANRQNDPLIDEYWKEKEKLLLNGNVKFRALGNIQPDEVYDFYQKTPVHVLVSTSSTEGIPVSMMEAISFGVPIISTDVGSCNEIVTDQTGVLVSADITATELATTLLEFKNSEKNREDFRNKTRKFWEENYDQVNNYNKVNQFIAQLN